MNDTLVITTGKGEYLTKRWLPSLRKGGKYSGIVLILDYDLSEDARNDLLDDPKIILSREQQILGKIFADRHRAIAKRLSPAYRLFPFFNTIMCVDGNDTIFFKPIQPLFEMAKNEVCYVCERKNLYEWQWLRGTPDAYTIWEKIMDEPLINSEVYVGPWNLILQAEKFMAERCRHFILDQPWLNALIYYFNLPAKRVDETWNYDGRLGYKIKNEKCYSMEGKEVAILHLIDSTLRG